ncbi:MAG: hypothetical protein IJ890_05470, partial [Clostridia bacterium]|nr:hypothetical protein [Clostridia bacterium]
EKNNRWELKELGGLRVATDENYENCCGKDTIKFFRRVFGSIETTIKKHNLTIHISRLNNCKHEHYFETINIDLKDLIEKLQNRFNLKDFANWEQEKIKNFIITNFETKQYYTDILLHYIDLYNMQYKKLN